MEQSEDVPPAVDQRNVRPRLEGHSQEAPGNEWVDNATPAINLREPSLGGHRREGGPSSSLPLMLPHQSPQNAGPNSDALNTSHQATVPPRIDREPTPTLMDVNPASGPIAGGPRIWLQGKDFPAHLPLFARFGMTVVRTVSAMEIPFEP